MGKSRNQEVSSTGGAGLYLQQQEMFQWEEELKIPLSTPFLTAPCFHPPHGVRDSKAMQCDRL